MKSLLSVIMILGMLVSISAFAKDAAAAAKGAATTVPPAADLCHGERNKDGKGAPKEKAEDNTEGEATAKKY